MSVSDDLHSRVRALGDLEIRGNSDASPAEVTGAEFLDARLEFVVEGVAYFVADGEEDGDDVLGVAEFHVERDSGQRDWGAVLVWA